MGFPFQNLFLGPLVEILLLAIPAVLLELSETRPPSLTNVLGFFFLQLPIWQSLVPLLAMMLLWPLQGTIK